MTREEAEVVRAASKAARFMPPPSFVRTSPGYKACKELVAAVKALRLAEREEAKR